MGIVRGAWIYFLCRFHSFFGGINSSFDFSPVAVPVMVCVVKFDCVITIDVVFPTDCESDIIIGYA